MPALSDHPIAVVLTPTSANDLEALIAIRIEAMRESLERIERFDPDRARERFVDGFDPNTTRQIEVAGNRVGFVVVIERGDSLLLDHLYIKPCAQGSGIGSGVLAQVFAEADELGRSIEVGALKESASNRFYLHHGFTLTGSGEFDNYYVRVSRSVGSPSD